MQKPIFVREATGLVRQLSVVDAFIMNQGILNMPLSVVWGFTTAAYLWPGVDLTAALFVGFLASIPIGMMCAQMSAAMPRSGGDYAWVTRTVRPDIGFMNNWAFMVITMYGAMVGNAWIFSTFFLSSNFATVGTLTNNPTLTQWGTLTASPIVGVAVASLLLIVSALISAFGLKAVRKVWLVLFIGMMLGVAGAMGTFAISSSTSFVTKFDSYSHLLGTTYEGLIQTARGVGWTPSYDPMAAFAALPFSVLAYGGFTYAVYVGGEIKQAGRSLLLSINMALLLGAVEWVGMPALLYYSAGRDFISALAYVSFAQPQANPLTVPGTFNTLLAILTVDNPILFWLTFIGFVASYIVLLVIYFQIVSRVFFAWSFDRIAPSFIADVSERTHAPIKSILVTLVFAEVFTFVWAFAPFALSLLNITLAYVACFAIMGLAGTLFPFRKKALFDQSPAFVKAKVGRIPIVTIFGLITTGMMIFAFIYSYMTPSFSGPTSPSALVFTGTVFLSGLAIFYVARTYRRMQGIDLGKTFMEIPPE